ncbi:MAG TPA: hypothetical protein PLX97_04575 [Gemmatales bacterium]|nr:hypothetical protein [Gemmatales bacterium]
MNETTPLPTFTTSLVSRAPTFSDRMGRLKTCGLLSGILLFFIVPTYRFFAMGITEVNLPMLLGQILFPTLFVAYVLAISTSQLFSYRLGTAVLFVIIGCVCLLAS